MRVCIGICVRYAAKKKKKGWYIEGLKRCDTCERFLKCDKINCPCCGARLSTRSKRSKKNVNRIG